MLAHILSILGLTLYTIEIARTIRRFGVRRGGSLGMMVMNPLLHMTGAVAFAILFFWLGNLDAVPDYVFYVGAGVSALYFIASLVFKVRSGKADADRIAEKERKLRERSS